MPKEFSTGLTVYIYIIIFIFGACIGSFINCAADRYVCKQSVLRGRSHCPSCGHALGILDLFPVISYLLLKGKCRYCGSKIPLRCLITELLGGIAYLLVVMRFGFSFVSLQYALLLPALLAVSLIDLDTMEIPNCLICYSTLIFVLFLPTYADYKSRLQDGLIGLLVFGGGTLILSLVMDFLLGKESLGGGDIKLFGVLGLFLGPVLGLFMLLLSCIVGLPFALVARKYSETTQSNETFPPLTSDELLPSLDSSMGIKSFSGVDFLPSENPIEAFPFGPAICFSAFITFIVGQNLVDLYLSLW